MILNGSITIASYFSFFADVANTWRSVSERSIFPGIQLAESLSVPGDAQAKMAKLDKWSKEAQEHIKTECGKVRVKYISFPRHLANVFQSDAKR